jgi:hypothetical protein
MEYWRDWGEDAGPTRGVRVEAAEHEDPVELVGKAGGR